MSGARGAAAAAATAARGLYGRAVPGTRELADGKRDIAEQVAGVIVVCCGHTFLIGHAVVRRLYEQLCGTLDTNDGKDAEGNIQVRIVRLKNELTVHHLADGIGDIVAIIQRAAVGTFAIDLGAKNDGIHALYDGNGIVVADGIQIADAAVVVSRIGGKGCDSSLSAVQNDVLLQNGQSLKYLTTTDAKAGFAFNFDKIPHGDLIESIVKRDLVDSHERPKRLGRTSTNAGCVGNDFFAEARQIDARVFKAISVAATVKHALRIDAYRSTVVKGESVCGVSVFGHDVSPKVNLINHGGMYGTFRLAISL